MLLAVDCHIHLYPNHSFEEIFRTAILHSPKTAYPVLCVVERAGGTAFRELSSGHTQLPTGWSVQMHAAGMLKIIGPSGELLLVAGRQIATKERLEVLAYGDIEQIADGLSLDETVRAVRDNGATPILNWAPGKWFGSRGKLVLQMIRSSNFTDLWLCDTTLRPNFWGEPLQMQLARERKIPILAGSDPLPFTGQEREVSRYGITAQVSQLPSSIAELSGILATQQPFFGKRPGLIYWFWRMCNFYLRK